MGKSALGVSRVAVLLLCLFAVAAQAQNAITTVAGGGPTGVAATTASIGFPAGVARFSGVTYFSDSRSSRVFKVDDATKTLTAVAGDTLAGNTGDYDPNNSQPQPATLASLNGPQGLTVDAAGNVYIADTNSFAIRVLNTGNQTATIAGVQIGAGAISTVVGCVNTPCDANENTAALSVNLNSPGSVALDASGNIYIADTANHAIRVVNEGATDIQIGAVTVHPGKIATVAGHLGGSGSSGDTGPATSAFLTSPSGVFVDGNGYIYIADTFNSAIRVVNPTGGDITVASVLIHSGDIDTVAGKITLACTPPACGDGGPARDANLNFPIGVSVDGGGNILIADTKDHALRAVDTGGNISILAGNYSACGTAPCGDGDLAANALLAAPSALAADGANIYLADENDNAIREITGADQKINSVAGTLSENQFYVAFYGDNGPATDAELFAPTAVAMDVANNLLIADTFNDIIRKVDFGTGNISTIVGTPEAACGSSPCGDGGAPGSAFLSYPTGLYADASGNTFIADYSPAVGGSPGVAVIREVVGGKITTIAGNYVGVGFSGDGGLATSAQLGGPTLGSTPPLNVFVDNKGIVYIADSLNQRIRVVNTTAKTITVAKINIGPGDINTVAGDGSVCAAPPSCGDGAAATSAQLNSPSAVATDSAGNIYIADSFDNEIRIVNNTSGVINTFAGNGIACASQGCGDGGAANSAELDVPTGVLVDYVGNVFISDTADYAVREVTLDGKIATVMGQQRHGFGGDGTNGLLAQPLGIAIDASGNVFAADVAQWRIRKVTGIAATAPAATPSPSSLGFGSQALTTTSSAKAITITNTGNITTLTISKVALTGTNAGDFAISSDKCTGTLAAGSSCEVDVTFTPTVLGARSASLTLTDSAPNSPQSIALSGTGIAAPSFVLPKPSPATQSVSAGSPATYTISVTAQNGFNSAVSLSCLASTVPAGASCSFAPASITGSQTSTLTISTTAARAFLNRPAGERRALPIYAMWLLLPAMLLTGASMSSPQRKKLISWMLLFFAVSGLLLLVACGGGSSSGGGGGGGGGGGTPTGNYTVTIQGTATGYTTQTTTVTLVVN